MSSARLLCAIGLQWVKVSNSGIHMNIVDEGGDGWVIWANTGAVSILWVASIA